MTIENVRTAQRGRAMLAVNVTVAAPPMPSLPQLNDEEIARRLRSLRKEMSILSMERQSGISRQVLYRIMGGSSVNRSPYELVAKLLDFMDGVEQGTGLRPQPALAGAKAERV